MRDTTIRDFNFYMKRYLLCKEKADVTKTGCRKRHWESELEKAKDNLLETIVEGLNKGYSIRVESDL